MTPCLPCTPPPSQSPWEVSERYVVWSDTPLQCDSRASGLSRTETRWWRRLARFPPWRSWPVMAAIEEMKRCCKPSGSNMSWWDVTHTTHSTICTNINICDPYPFSVPEFEENSPKFQVPQGFFSRRRLTRFDKKTFGLFSVQTKLPGTDGMASERRDGFWWVFWGLIRTSNFDVQPYECLLWGVWVQY